MNTKITANKEEFVNKEDYKRYMANRENIKRGVSRAQTYKSIKHSIKSLLDDHKYYEDYSGPIPFTNEEQADRILSYLKNKNIISNETSN